MIKTWLILATSMLFVLCDNVEVAVKKEYIPREAFKQMHTSDKFKTFQQIANENGFRVETYQVVTTDGYILQVFRIPGKLEEKNASNSGKPVVLMQHALVCDMMVWIMNEASVAPAFFLANQGYDVWLGNNRGNRFSDQHTSLDPNSKEYWQFDWEQMGTGDQPAVINFILSKTGQNKLSYIGHSQGTTQLMAGASLLPEFYNSKINIAVLLAPPASMYYNQNVGLKFLSTQLNQKLILAALNTVKFWNILPYNFATSVLAEQVCKLFDGKICDLVFKIGAQWHDIDNVDRKDMYVSNLPSGASVYSYAHYGQLIQQSKPAFKRYDYGKRQNMAKYGQATPPDYDLSAINFPIAIASGSLDDLAHPKDVAWLTKQFNNGVLVFNKEYLLAHESFMIAKDMTWFTHEVFPVLKKYSGLEKQAPESQDLYLA